MQNTACKLARLLNITLVIIHKPVDQLLLVEIQLNLACVNPLLFKRPKFDFSLTTDQKRGGAGWDRLDMIDMSLLDDKTVWKVSQDRIIRRLICLSYFCRSDLALFEIAHH